MNLKNNTFNKLHLVEKSPWPFTVSLGMLCLTSGSMWKWHFKESLEVSLGLLIIILSAFLWWSDVKYESNKGFHNNLVTQGLRGGMILFIISEVMFFFSFFWAYFHSNLATDSDLGFSWPPFSYKNLIIDPYAIPLLKSLLLLSSGVTVTWSHHSIKKKTFESVMGLVITMILGVAFMGFQVWEYKESLLSMSSSAYGSVFFLMTGFHGTHVTMGIMFLFFCLTRIVMGSFSKTHHVGLEAAMWYWHFVDVVWLFLYFFVYWFGFFC